MGNKRVENVPGQSLRTEYTQAHKLSSTQTHKLKLTSTKAYKLTCTDAQKRSSTQGTKAQATELVRALRRRAPRGFLELKCEVQWLGNTRVLEWRVWRSPGKRHASSVMLLLPIFVIFMWSFNVEKSFQMCHIPLLLQVAPYCDIMNCVTGA